MNQRRRAFQQTGRLDPHDLPPLAVIPTHLEQGSAGRSPAAFWAFYDALPGHLRVAYNYAANGLQLKGVHAETCRMVYGE